MSRTDELTGRLIDGTLTDPEAAELHDRLAADPAARDRHVALLDLEAALRGLRTDLDLGAATVARIEADRAERVAGAVLAGIARGPRPAWARRPARRWTVAATLFTLAAAVLVALWIGRPVPDVLPPPMVDATTDLARLTVLNGSAEVSGPDGPVVVGAGQALAAGQVLRTVGEDSTAVVEFTDRTRVELHSDTAVRIGGPTSPWRLFLVEGQLTAFVVGQPTVVGTGPADMVAHHGQFSLWSSGPESARVELQEGDLQVIRADMPEPVSLRPGRAAFVRDRTTPVRIEAPLRMTTEPRARLGFPGALDVAFAESGRQVWAVSGRQWARWPVGAAGNDPAVVPQLLLPKVKNDGPVALLSADRRSLVTGRVDDRDRRLQVRDLPSGAVRHSLPDGVPEPRFVCLAPDGSWVATVVHRPVDQLRVWDTATGRERFRRPLDARAFCLAPTPDGRHVAVDVTDLRHGTANRVDFLDAATGESAFSLPTRRRQVTALAFSADGRLVAAGFNGAVQVWDVRERKLVRTLEGFERVVTRLAFGADARVLAAGTQDGRVWVWSTDTGPQVQVIETGSRGVRSMAFSPDGRTLVTATNKAGVAVWDVVPEPAG